MMKTTPLRPIPSFLLPFTQSTFSTQIRWAHRRGQIPSVPEPTPFVPDTQTFLTLIGRNLSQHADKFKSWRALFTVTSEELKTLGIEPPRTRRYLLRWLEKFRQGYTGLGGDFQHVKDGVVEMRVKEIPTTRPTRASASTSAGMCKVVVNVEPAGAKELDAKELRRQKLRAKRQQKRGVTSSPPAAREPVGIPVRGYRLKGKAIVGSYAQPLKGGNAARIVITEGMWEDRRGRKIDGGERRQAEVRFKRRAEERRAAK